MSDAPPKHAYEVAIRVGGCDWARVLEAIERFADHIRVHGPDCNLVSGGAGTSGDIRVERREVTESQYNAELAEWLEQHRAGATDA